MLWKPPGVSEQDTARWDAEPFRSTYFLELIAEEKREGRFLHGNPTNSHYNMLIKAFWEKFQVYHTKSQFKNHFCAKKSLWNLVCWAQNSTGISWDHERKMVIASPEWWEENKERKGLSALKDKSVADYDLLEYVYRGQHAEGEYMRDPRIPRWPPTQVNLDSDREDDPEAETQETEPPTQSYRRCNRVTPSAHTGRKKQKTTRPPDRGTESSPVVQHIDHIMTGFFEKMESMNRRSTDPNRRSVGLSNEDIVESPAIPPPVVFASFADAVRVLVEEMKMDVSSEVYQDAQEMFFKSKEMREVLLRMPAEQRWPWLSSTLHRQKSSVSTPTKNVPTSD